MGTRWTSKHTGQKIDDTIDSVCNPNLLDNWYFGNPVNQRGISSGNGPVNAYGIDRWKFLNAGTLTIGSDYIAIASDQHAYTLQQYIEPGRFAGVIGMTATLSALVKGNGRLKISLGSASAGAYSDYFNYSDWTLVQMQGMIVSGTDYHIYVQARQGKGNCYVKAVKLELGDQQTLAHQDANGNWVLNEIPDYGEQLRRCQRYFIRLLGYPNHFAGSTGNGNNIEFFIPGISLRDTPAVSGLTNVSIRYSSGASNTAFTLNAIAARAHGVYISGSVASVGNASAYSGISVASSTEFSLSADL